MQKHTTSRGWMPVINISDVDRPSPRLTACQAMEALGDVIYVIRLRDDTIKIGWTTNLAQRKRSWRMPDNLGILAVKPGTLDEEQAIHARLVAHRKRGEEYYHPTAEVLAEVNALRQAVGMDPLSG